MRTDTLPGGPSWAAMCAHPSWDALYAGVLGRCRVCGLVATAQKPAFSYDADYFTGGGNGGYDFESAFARAFDAARFGEELARLERIVGRGTVLDIGCATGSFLVQAQQRGWSVAGVEPVAAARDHTARRTGADILESLDALPQRRFDVVTLHHVLEHIHDPLPFLRDEIRPRVGQLLLVEVPNFASLPSRADGLRWRDLRPEQHVCHYDRTTLRHLAEAAGYRVRRIFTLWVPLWSARTALDVLRVLPAAGRRRRTSDADPSESQIPLAVGNTGAYRPSAGWRQVADRTSYALMRPIVRGLEALGLGERLVLEAVPVSRDSRGSAS